MAKQVRAVPTRSVVMFAGIRAFVVPKGSNVFAVFEEARRRAAPFARFRQAREQLAQARGLNTAPAR